MSLVQEFRELNQLPPETIYGIVQDLHYLDLRTFCNSDPYFRELCRNPSFNKLLTKKRYSDAIVIVEVLLSLPGEGKIEFNLNVIDNNADFLLHSLINIKLDIEGAIEMASGKNEAYQNDNLEIDVDDNITRITYTRGVFNSYYVRTNVWLEILDKVLKMQEKGYNEETNHKLFIYKDTFSDDPNAIVSYIYGPDSPLPF